MSFLLFYELLFIMLGLPIVITPANQYERTCRNKKIAVYTGCIRPKISIQGR